VIFGLKQSQQIANRGGWIPVQAHDLAEIRRKGERALGAVELPPGQMMLALSLWLCLNDLRIHQLFPPADSPVTKNGNCRLANQSSETWYPLRPVQEVKFFDGWSFGEGPGVHSVMLAFALRRKDSRNVGLCLTG